MKIWDRSGPHHSFISVIISINNLETSFYQQIDGSILLMGGLKNDVWRINTAGSVAENPSHTYSVGVLPLPGYTNAPTDPDNDDLYEDLNGNNRLDFADVVLYFNQMGWIAAHEPVSAFDLNGNGRIDFADIVRLFGEI